METPEIINRHTFHDWLEYHERWWSTIPLVGKKPPKGFAWKQYQTRRPTLGEIRVWCDQYENIGILTGEISGVTVVDCENREESEWWYKQYETPLIVKTGRGFHFYYQYAEIGNRVRVLDRKIDIRGDGGYVVAPPSIHPETGTQYEWMGGSEYELDDVPRFDPTWLPEKKAVERLDVRAASGELVETARRYIMQILAVSGRGGHNSTFRAACKAVDFGLSEHQVLNVMMEWNETNAEPKWSQSEIQHKVADAFSRKGESK